GCRERQAAGAIGRTQGRRLQCGHLGRRSPGCIGRVGSYRPPVGIAALGGREPGRSRFAQVGEKWLIHQGVPMSVKRLGWGPVLLLGGLLLGVPSSRAVEDKKDDELTPDKVVEEITNAYKLADFGHKNKSPEALIAAGSVLRSLKGVKLAKITEEPKVEGNKKS